MTDSRSLPDHQILQQAAEWFVALADEPVSETDEARWRIWLESNSEHRLAWQYVERVGQRFQSVQQQVGNAQAGRILHSARTQRLNRRKLIGGGLSCLAGFLSWRYTPVADTARQLAAGWSADHRTGTGETRQLALADGGELWLNTASALDIHYSSELRHIELYDGEVLIQTAKDPRQRPFVVDSRQGRLHALGTRFVVRQRLGNTLLAVYEGAVEITTLGGSRRVLQAGEQTHFDGRVIQVPQSAQDARRAWAGGRILAENIPLGELASELSRYRPGYLGVDPAVADIPVIGAYPIDSPDHALAMLEEALPIRVNRLLPWWITLEPVR